MWRQIFWFSWIILPFALGMDNTATPKPSYGSGGITTAHTVVDGWFAPRQVPLPAIPDPTTTSSTYDFWWPFPAAPTPTPDTPPIPAFMPPIILSIASDSSTTPSTVPSSSVASSTSFSSTSATSSLQSTSSPSGTPTSAAASASPFGFIDLVPVLAAVGLFLVGLGLWLLYGCCTRKPRIRTDDEDLICGPPYPSRNASDARRDIEERGREEEEEMLQIPKYGRRGISGQYRWPSFSEPPPFDPVKGFYVPDQYKDDDEDQYFTATLFAPQAISSRSKTVRTQRSSKSKRSAAAAAAGPSRSRSSPCSDSTSVALLELYESDEEEVAHRKAKETPWESLRHKSIKRGILEQVKKENNWMDSIRSSIQCGSGFLLGHAHKMAEEEGHVLPANEDTGAQTVEAQRHLGKRRGHAKADSDLFIDPASSVLPILPTSVPSGSVAADIRPLKVSKSKSKSKAPLNSGVSTPGVRRGFTQLKDDPSNMDIFTPLPARARVTEGRSRSRSRSRSQSASPVKAMSNNIGGGTTLGLGASDTIPIPISRDIFPASPSQIMSPPLESQMCFTPIPRSVENIPTPPTRAMSKSKSKSRSRSRIGASPTKIPTPRKGRKLQPRTTPPLLPFPDGDAYRGRLLKKRSGPDFFKPPKALKNKHLHITDTMVDEPEAGSSSAAALISLGMGGEFDGVDAMKRVDQIVESSWGARDLREEDIRCLSPSAFGSQV